MFQVSYKRLSLTQLQSETILIKVELTSNLHSSFSFPTNPPRLSLKRTRAGAFMSEHKKALADPKILGRAKEAPHPVRLKYGALFRHRSIHKKAPPVSTSISDVRRQHSIRQGQWLKSKLDEMEILKVVNAGAVLVSDHELCRMAHARSAVQAMPRNVRQRVEYSEPSQRSRVPQAVTPTEKLTSIHVN